MPDFTNPTFLAVLAIAAFIIAILDWVAPFPQWVSQARNTVARLSRFTATRRLARLRTQQKLLLEFEQNPHWLLLVVVVDAARTIANFTIGVGCFVLMGGLPNVQPITWSSSISAVFNSSIPAII